VEAVIALVTDGKDNRIPGLVRTHLMALSIQVQALSIAVSCSGIDRTRPAGDSMRSRRWTGARHRARRQRRRSKGTLGPRLLGLGCLGPEAEFERRYGRARQYHEGRRAVSGDADVILHHGVRGSSGVLIS
jgi:hypothetical protein